MSTETLGGWARILGSLALFAIATFVAAGGLVALFPSHGTAILVGWILALFVGTRLLRSRAGV